MVTLGAKTVEKKRRGTFKDNRAIRRPRRHQGQVNCNLDGMKHSTLIVATSITIMTMEQLVGINPNRLKHERQEQSSMTLHLCLLGK